jgi:general secretion pathway protein J
MKTQRGFTLVEVLVALLAMALLAALAWQGLDSVFRSRDAGRVSVDRTVRMATVLTQWEQDLLAVHDSGAVPALGYDGQSLRITRRAERGVMLVSWSVRGGTWQRWASPTYVNAGELQDAWLRSHQLVGTEAGHLVMAEAASEWQVYFYRDNGWSNPQSTGNLAPAQAPVVQTPVLQASPPQAAASGASAPAAGAAPPPAPAAAPAPVQQREILPNAVRVIITLGGQKLTRDVLLGPTGA